MIVITCGGTGGHIYPGLAIGMALKAKGETLHYIGSLFRMEKEKIPAAGFGFDGLPVQQLRKQKPFRSLNNLFQSTLQARRILKAKQPKAVVGLGSYITVPTILAARSLGIPIILIETNVIAGKANQFLGKMASLITLAHAQTAAAFPSGRTRVTGSPIRPEFGQLSREAGAKVMGLSPEKLTLTVIGGSQGAQKINQAVVAALGEILSESDWQVVLISGNDHYDEIRRQTQTYAGHSGFRLLNYVENMPALLACTDLAVSRAGASILAELLACEVPTVLIPGHFGGGHQLDNAQAIVLANAGIMIREEALDVEFLPRLRDVMRDTERLKQMAQNCSTLNPPNATDVIADLVLQTARHTREIA